MQVKPEVFPKLLEKGLAPIYLVSGDEELLLNEFSDRLISKARSEGFTERKIINVDLRFFLNLSFGFEFLDFSLSALHSIIKI